MLLTEYDESKTMELFKEDGRRKGRVEGRAEGVLLALVGLVKNGVITIAEAAKHVGMTPEDFKEKAGLINPAK